MVPCGVARVLGTGLPPRVARARACTHGGQQLHPCQQMLPRKVKRWFRNLCGCRQVGFCNRSDAWGYLSRWLGHPSQQMDKQPSPRWGQTALEPIVYQGTEAHSVGMCRSQIPNKLLREGQSPTNKGFSSKAMKIRRTVSSFNYYHIPSAFRSPPFLFLFKVALWRVCARVRVCVHACLGDGGRVVGNGRQCQPPCSLCVGHCAFCGSHHCLFASV
jgi:hypothetical protein